MNVDTLTDHFKTDDLLRVIVGPEQVQYYLHKQALAARCPYFAGLLAFKGVEVAETTVTLHDFDVSAFKVFVAFIYTNTYCLPELEEDELFILDAKIYVLADRLYTVSSKPTTINKPDQMRELVSDMITADLENMMDDNGFSEVVRSHGELGVDLLRIMAVYNGSSADVK
ncbi:hypothetical protein K440DRAFT_635993 [Wilcoxina mikolae CBS 423.85]|nr:hypothetical protein K440DRAFT_635993 [Wilcoxina mikolae CBS 423.85]